jgi:dipeptidyl-peptidase-4
MAEVHGTEPLQGRRGKRGIGLLLLALPAGLACRAADPAPSASGSPRRLLTLEQTSGRGDPVDFTGELPRYSWAADGVHLALEERQEGQDEPHIRWFDPLSWEESAPPPAAPEGNGDLAAALLTAGVGPELAEKIPPRAITRTPQGAALLELAGDLWWVEGGAARPLADDADGAIELPETAPDGAHVSFVQANDLVLARTRDGERRELTSDGSQKILNGKLDWVYQEEVYGRGDFRGSWWSPDGRRLAFLRLDEAPVHEFTFVDHIEDGHARVRLETMLYPKAGDPNPLVALGIADVEGDAAVRWIDLSAHAAEEPLIVRVDWTPGGDELWFMLQDRLQSWLELLAADPASGATRTVLREASSGWVDRPEPPRWLADGTFLWESARTGQRHLYRYRRDGTLLGAVTAGDWSVTGVEAVDEERGLVWFTATKDGVLDSNLYRSALDGSGLVRLTRGPGRHQARWNGARTLFLDRVSSLSDPPRLLLCDGEGEVLRELGRAEPEDLELYSTGRFELHRVTARDGLELDVGLLRPIPCDPDRRYPIWLPTYSGPDAPSLTNSWSTSAWYQFLAQNGVMVLLVNVRSASGKGHALTESVHLRLGEQELMDLEDAVAWACREQGGDPARVGITGGSYGGFMAAYALTHSDAFALGIAASGVYDWRLYDTIYTERYMSTPQQNPEGYAASSVIEAASELRGHLVLTHGELDDNVHLQNAVQLVHALQKADRDFEFVLYPQSGHGIGDRDLRWWDRRLTWRLIEEHLLRRQPTPR